MVNKLMSKVVNREMAKFYSEPNSHVSAISLTEQLDVVREEDKVEDQSKIINKNKSFASSFETE